MSDSRGVALAEIEVMKQVEEARADGRTEFADALQATIVTTAAQREAALVPRPPPENESGGAQRRRRSKELQAERHRNEQAAAMRAALRSAAVCFGSTARLAPRRTGATAYVQITRHRQATKM